MGNDIVYDADSNIIGCKYCGSRNLRKCGFLYRAKSKKQQWLCNNCGRKSVSPKILEKSQFEKEISELTEDGSPYWQKTHPNHAKTVERVFKLREQLNG